MLWPNYRQCGPMPWQCYNAVLWKGKIEKHLPQSNLVALTGWNVLPAKSHQRVPFATMHLNKQVTDWLKTSIKMFLGSGHHYCYHTLIYMAHGKSSNGFVVKSFGMRNIWNELNIMSQLLLEFSLLLLSNAIVWCMKNHTTITGK